jgi:hypothetical protein
VEGDGGRRPHPAFGERELGRDVRVEVIREQADVDLLVAVFTLNGRVGVVEDVSTLALEMGVRPSGPRSARGRLARDGREAGRPIRQPRL